MDGLGDSDTFTGDGPPQISSTTVLSPTQIQLTFDQLIGVRGVGADYDISPGTLNVIGVGGAGTNVILTFDDVMVEGQGYTVSIVNDGNIEDTSGNAVVDGLGDSDTFTGDGPPKISSIIAIDALTIQITFDQNLSTIGASTDYGLSGSLSVTAVNPVGGFPNMVELTNSPAQTPSLPYTLDILNHSAITDTSGNQMISGTGDSGTFTGYN